jgi:hypothetical protein
VDVKQAVAAAISAVQNLFAGQDIRDLLLEEVEKSEDDRHWRVTISFARLIEGGNALRTALAGPEYNRFYKVIELDAVTGNLVSMKIRKI